MEGKGLHVNTDKTKIMISGLNRHSLRDSGNFPCGVCHTGVDSNSIFCGFCALIGYTKNAVALHVNLHQISTLSARGVSVGHGPLMPECSRSCKWMVKCLKWSTHSATSETRRVQVVAVN